MRHPQYLISCTKKFLFRQGFACPSCGGRRSKVVDRKWVVTTLRRCHHCRLLFRTPTTTSDENERIYQRIYQEGFTTIVPDDEELSKLKTVNFRNSEKDYGKYITVLAALGGRRGQRLYDYGCSWGYGSYQLTQAGYKVDSYDISISRANIARDRLGANLVDPAAAGINSYDIVFSSHVIEHVHSVTEMSSMAMRLLKPGGLFVSFTPNGGRRFRKAHYAAWHSMWGFVHPQLLDEEYVRCSFDGFRYVIAGEPFPLKDLNRFPVEAPLILPQTGVELMFAVQKP